MKSFTSVFLSAIFLISSLSAQDENIKDFSLSEKEKKELEKIKKIQDEFKKKYPDWVDTGEEGEFIDYRLGKSIEKRKTDYIKKQRAILKRIEEEKKRKIEEEKKRKVEEEKKRQEAERKEKEKKERFKQFVTTPIGSAMELLKAKKYNEAYDAFYALFLEDTASARINFYLGLSASGAKRYEEGVSAFERVLIVEPNHIRARLELARSLFFLKLFDEAEAEFKKVLESGEVPQEVLDNVKKFMVAIEDSRIRNHFNAAVMFGVQYDTNINNDVGQNNYVIDPDAIPGGVKGESPKSDGVHQEMANLNHIYDFGKLGDYFMQNSFTAFAQNYLANEEKNLLFYSLSTGIVGNKERFNVGAKFHYDTVQIDSVEFLNALGVELKYSQPVTATMILEGKIRHQQKSFPDIPDNDSSFNEVSVNGQKKIKDSKDFYSGNLLLSNERAKDSTATDRDILGLKAGYSKFFTPKQTVNGSVGYKTISYTKESLDENLELSKRADTQLTLSLQHIYKLDKKKVVTASFTYLDNTSSHAAFDYDKMLIGANMLWLF